MAVHRLDASQAQPVPNLCPTKSPRSDDAQPGICHVASARTTLRVGRCHVGNRGATTVRVSYSRSTRPIPQHKINTQARRGSSLVPSVTRKTKRKGARSRRPVTKAWAISGTSLI